MAGGVEDFVGALAEGEGDEALGDEDGEEGGFEVELGPDECCGYGCDGER